MAYQKMGDEPLISESPSSSVVFKFDNKENIPNTKYYFWN